MPSSKNFQLKRLPLFATPSHSFRRLFKNGNLFKHDIQKSVQSLMVQLPKSIHITIVWALSQHMLLQWVCQFRSFSSPSPTLLINISLFAINPNLKFTWIRKNMPDDLEWAENTFRHEVSRFECLLQYSE